jgi:hypothetical protein
MPAIKDLTEEEFETILTILKDKRDSGDDDLPADLDELIEKVEAAQIRSRTSETGGTPTGAA